MNTKIAGAAVQNVRINFYHEGGKEIVAEICNYGMRVIFKGEVDEAMQFLYEKYGVYQLVNGLEALNDLNTIFRVKL
jgi:hypothetical protein